MRTQKKAIGTAQRSATQTAYVKRYDAPSAFAFPEQFELAQYNLLLSESFRGPNQTVIFLYWASEERARAQEPVVEAALGIANGQVLGEVVQVLTPSRAKWTETPAKWGTWVLSAAALFGALSVIRDNFTEFFALPHVVIFPGNSAAADVHSGDLLDIPIVVRNQARLGRSEVRLNVVQLKPLEAADSPSGLRFDIFEIPQLQAGQNADVHIRGTAPIIHDSLPHQYALEMQAIAEEGHFVPGRRVDFSPFTITIWPDRTSDVQIVRVSELVARVVITLRSGVATPGLKAQLIFASAIPPEPDGIVLTSGAIVTEKPIIATGPNGSLAKIQFLTGALQPLRRYSYEISIVFPHRLTESQWNDLRSSMKVTIA